MRPDKNELRKTLYAKRQEIVERHPETVARLQNCIALWLTQNKFFCAGFYRAFRYEPDISEVLISWSRRADKKLALPRVDNPTAGLMHFALWTEDMPMVKGAFGIEEPLADTVAYPDVIFSPCVGVNINGFRLGNGGGFFDRYLLQRRLSEKPVVTVAIAFEELIVDENYQQTHDIAFDWVVTQKGFFKTKPLGAEANLAV